MTSGGVERARPADVDENRPTTPARFRHGRRQIFLGIRERLTRIVVDPDDQQALLVEGDSGRSRLHGPLVIYDGEDFIAGRDRTVPPWSNLYAANAAFGQNTYWMPTCIVRLPRREVMNPKSGRVGLDTAFPSRVLLRILKASSRRSSRCAPTMANDFRNDVLSSQKPGLRRKFFAKFVANVPAVGAANALLSNQVARLIASFQSTRNAFGS